MTKQEKIKQLETDVKVGRQIIERLRLCQTRLTEKLSEIIKDTDLRTNDFTKLTSEKETCLLYGDISVASWYKNLNKYMKFLMLEQTFRNDFFEWITCAFDEPYNYKKIDDALNDGLHVLSLQTLDNELVEIKGETK